MTQVPVWRKNPDLWGIYEALYTGNSPSVTGMVVGIVTVIICGSNIVGFDLPDWLARTLGILDLAAVFALIFTTFKKVMNKQ